MKPLIRHLAFFLLWSLCPSAVAYAIAGSTAAWFTLSLCLFGWLVWSWFHTVRLLQWLQKPGQKSLPEGSGLWQDIFTLLHRREKNRRKHKRQLAETTRRFIRAAEAAPNGVILLNPEGGIEWFNRLAAVHLGLNPRQDRQGILKNLVRTPEFHDFLNRKRSRQGPTITLRLQHEGQAPRSITVSRAALGKNQLLTTQDTTAAEHADTTRTAFVANVSHELRTPLTVINGFLETMAEMPELPQAQQQQFIGLMRQEGQRMLSLLADLLTLTRLEDRLAPSTPVRINLSALCHQIAEDGRVLSDGRHSIHTDILPDVFIQGVQNDLYSALSNLVFNAVRYTPEGGRIDVQLQAENHGVRLRVCDNGNGIAPEHLPHLTERFYRVDAGRSRQSGGTGLGLAITKHALLKHGTDLDIRSEVGKGSEFSAWFAVSERKE